MTLDEGVLRDVEIARAHLEELEDRAYEARAGLHQSIRRLHAAGGSMREIAAALGMSHQRVHQIIGEDSIVEVETTATEVGHLPVVPAPTAVAVTAGEDACSFCGSPRRELDKLLAAPGPVFICSGCVGRVTNVLEGRNREADADLVLVPTLEDATCSFCHNGSAVVGAMAEGGAGGTRICERCAASCRRLLHQEEPKRRRTGKVRCSFCNVSQVETKKLIAGPGIYICESCIAGATEVVAARKSIKGPRQVVLADATKEPHACAFCGKVPAQVTAMVRGGRGRICNECVDLCNDILEEEAVT